MAPRYAQVVVGVEIGHFLCLIIMQNKAGLNLFLILIGEPSCISSDAGM